MLVTEQPQCDHIGVLLKDIDKRFIVNAVKVAEDYGRIFGGADGEVHYD